MTASLVFRLARTRLAASAACVAVTGPLPVRAAKAGVCPVAPRRVVLRANPAIATVEATEFERHPLAQAPLRFHVQAQSMVEPWFTGRYSGQRIATSKRGLDSRITKAKYSAQTGMEGPGPAA